MSRSRPLGGAGKRRVEHEDEDEHEDEEDKEEHEDEKMVGRWLDRGRRGGYNAAAMEPRTLLARKMLATIRERGLFGRGDRVVAAVSGGPDSMALLDVLAGLQERLGLWICVAHLDHGLRAAAGADAAFVAAQAERLGLDVQCGFADVAAERLRAGGSVEMAARRARYAFLGRVARETHAGKVAVGHTADDQVETILLKLLRGEELGALCGMPAARRLAPASAAWLVRPLLDATRAEVLEHLAARGLAFRVDESNADTSFGRNAVRHELLPALEARCGEALRGLLLGSVDAARGLARILEEQASRLVASAAGEAVLDLRQAGAAPRLLRRMAARRAYAAAGGSGPLGRGALDAVEGLLAGGSGREVSLADGVVAERSYGQVRFHRPDPPRREAPRERGTAARVALPVPGRVEVWAAGLWVEAERLTERPRALPADRRWEEVVDLERAGEPLVVRPREAGDRFVPLGLGASKKLKDFFIDQRVPREDRARALLVEGPHGVVWVVGLRLDARAAVRPDSRRFLRLRAGPLEARGPRAARGS